MVQHLTIRVNTFPSGHTAGSLAVGLAVIGALPWTGAALLLIAAGNRRGLRRRSVPLRGRCRDRRRARTCGLAGEFDRRIRDDYNEKL